MERALLESLKFLCARDILQVAPVCKLWQSLCSRDELWLHFLGTSRNLLRLQLSPPPSLRAAYRLALVAFTVVPREKTLRVYYPATRKWRITHLQAEWKEGFGMVSLGNSELFCCGGEDSARDTFKVSLVTGRIQVLPPMSPHKTLTGLCVLHTCVYSLCGRLKNELTSLCARFDLLTCQWEALPPALHVRQCFTPSVYQGLIYIPGGCSSTVETFDPVSMQFQTLVEDCGLSGPVDSIIWQDKLHVLNLHGCFVWDLERKTSEFIERNETYYLGTSCFPPICRDRKAIFVWHAGNRSMAYEMDLETLEYSAIRFQKARTVRKRKRQSY